MENSKKIGVVDDEFFISKSLSFILEKAGYSCFIACDGQSGLEMIKREKPGLVILDIAMPRMNGYQMCKEVRNDPEIKDTYIIMLTAMGQESNQRASLEAGANEYMLKPFNPRLIEKRVAEVLKNNG